MKITSCRVGLSGNSIPRCFRNRDDHGPVAITRRVRLICLVRRPDRRDPSVGGHDLQRRRLQRYRGAKFPGASHIGKRRAGCVPMSRLVFPCEMLVLAIVKRRRKLSRLHIAHDSSVYADPLLHFDVVIEAVRLRVRREHHVSRAYEARLAVPPDHVMPVLEDAKTFPRESGVHLRRVVHPNCTRRAARRAGTERVALQQRGRLRSSRREVVQDTRAHHSAAYHHRVSRYCHLGEPFRVNCLYNTRGAAPIQTKEMPSKWNSR